MSKELLIEKLTEKGEGVAYDENRNKIIIKNCFTQDLVLAELSKKRKGIIKGNLLEVLKPSIHRVNPKCSHTEICGGCSFQNLNYDYQLEIKNNKVWETFKEFKDTNYYSIIPASDIYEYRNKMEFSFSENRKKTSFLGLMIKGQKKFVFNVDRCHLADEWFSNILKIFKAFIEKYNFSSYNMMLAKGFFKTLTLKHTKNKKQKLVMLTLSDEESLSQDQKNELKDNLLKTLKDDQTLSFFIATQIVKKGNPTELHLEKIHGNDFITEDLEIRLAKDFYYFKFNISALSFFQPNPKQAEILYSTAINYLNLEELKNKTILDLYCGTGTLGMIFSKIAKEVIGVELNNQACEMARKNILLNNISNFEILNGDVKDILPEIIKNKKNSHLIVVDPPRCGLQENSVKSILEISPKYILYISCNVNTQLEDIKLLSWQYKLEIIHPVDQFPHTYHIENIAILKKLDFV